MAHVTITELETQLAKIGSGVYGPEVTFAYCETGRYKPYTESTIRAAARRGYTIESRVRGVYHVYPKDVT